MTFVYKEYEGGMSNFWLVGKGLPPTPSRENPFVPYPPPPKKGESHKFLKNHLAKPPQRVAENL